MPKLNTLSVSLCSRTNCNGFMSSRRASKRPLSVLQASRPHLEEDHILPGAAAPGNSSVSAEVV